MNEDTAPNPFADLEERFNDDATFARVERRTTNEIVGVSVIPASQDWLDARSNIDDQSADFKEEYADGYPLLQIALRGLDVEYQFNDERVKYLLIPMMSDKPDQYGEPRGRNSQIHLTRKAFVDVFGLRPFGPNQAKLLGMKAVWGQYLGEFEGDKNETIEYDWDMPRERLPDDYAYEGDVRIIKPRKTASASAGVTAGTTSLTDEEANAAILEVLVGRSSKDIPGANEAVREIKGLSSDWYAACATEEEAGVLGFGEKRQLVTAKGGKVIEFTD